MDKLSIFSKGETTVSLESKENNTIDTVVEGLGDIERGLELIRRGKEAWDWGQPVEGNDEVDLEDIIEEAS